jgi:2-oxoglutarate dehydrogenase E1 component
MSPIIHVNGDQPELVDQAIRLAVEYRQKFQSDIFIDIVGYRRYGHNEQDQPSFTQPMMYQKINEHRPVYHMYRDRIISEGIISKSDAEKLWNEEMKKVKQSYSESMETNFDIKKWTHTMFHRVVDLSALGNIKNTGVDSKILKDFGKKICEIPQGFNPHPMIKKIYEHRMKSIETGTEIDYATA